MRSSSQHEPLIAFIAAPGSASGMVMKDRSESALLTDVIIVTICRFARAGNLRINPVEPQIGQIEIVHKYVDHTDRIVFTNPIFKAFREQRALLAVRSLNKVLHPDPSANRAGIITRKSLPSARFYTTKTQSCH